MVKDETESTKNLVGISRAVTMKGSYINPVISEVNHGHIPLGKLCQSSSLLFL